MGQWRHIIGGNTSIDSKRVGFYRAIGDQNDPTQLPGGRRSNSLIVIGDALISFAGLGYTNNTVNSYCSDLWTFNLNTFIWDWRAGSSIVGFGTIDYGTRGQYAASNAIGARYRQKTISLGESYTEMAIFGGFGWADGTGLTYLSGMVCLLGTMF